MRQSVITVVGGLLALAAVAACDRRSVGESLDSTTAPTPTPEVQTTSEVPTPQGADVPDCYPEGAPRPDGEVMSSVSFSQDDTFVCTFTVKVGELAPAMDGYQAALVADGWALAFDNSGDTRSFAVSKGDLAMLVSGEPAGGTSTMSVTVVPGELVSVPTPADAR